MINMNNYAKAYVELYEIIKNLTLEDQNKIPKEFINFIKDNMDKNYSFVFDNRKKILEQDIKVETKALLVKIYEKYLSKPEEKEFWKQYDRDCLKIEEDKKIKNYNNNYIFKKKKNNNDN